MDVRCERCSTEYELEEDRIPPSGAAVKCTSCGHVFKVRRRAVLVTGAPEAENGAAGRREWRVRQPSGNVFTFKELTTLQKWIVERKVSRDDEISATGDKWKRLGDIGELATFFQVVDAASRASDVPPAPAPPPAPVAEPRPDGGEPPAERPEPAPPAESEPEEVSRRGGGAGMWLAALLIVAALGVGAWFVYAEYWLPMQERPRVEAPPVEAADAGVAVAPAEPPSAVAVALDAGSETPADAGAAGEATASAAPLDAGSAPIRGLEAFMAQGDRLRERDRAEQALDVYGTAADLYPARAEPLAGRGYALLDLGRMEPAEAAFREALRLNPRYAVAIMGLAETYRQMGRKSEAIEQYERYLEIQPNGSEAPLARAAIRRLKE